MKYDIDMLAGKLNFEPVVVEKACRIGDILAEIYRDPFLGERLSLTGGTALNLIYGEEIPRLSVDLDFNYRHINSEDWGEARDRIDERLKAALGSMGYDDFTINPSYPLGRINAAYSGRTGRRDELKLEIGYLQRFPFLREDVKAQLHHVGKDKPIEVLTPRKEELFAGKLIAGVGRRTPTDVFDVATISDLEFDPALLRKCTILKSLTGEMRINELNPERVFETVDIDTALSNLLRRDLLDTIDFERIKARATDLLRNLKNSLTPEEILAVEKFYEEGEFDPDPIFTEKDFHEELEKHPAIQWTLRNL